MDRQVNVVINMIIVIIINKNSNTDYISIYKTVTTLRAIGLLLISLVRHIAIIMIMLMQLVFFGIITSLETFFYFLESNYTGM